MSRVKRGFHRLGIVIAVPQLILAAVILALSQRNADPRFFAVLFTASAVLCYAAARGIAWVIEGFGKEAVPRVAVSKSEPIVSRFEPAFAGMPYEHSEVQHEIVIPAKRESRKPRDLNGVRGWLILPALGTLITPFVAAKAVYGSFDAAFRVPLILSKFVCFVYAELTCNIVLFVASIMACYFLYKRSSSYPITFIIVGIFAALIAVFDALILTQYGLPLTEADAQVIGRCVGNCVIWVPYMLFSKRVRSTFTQP